MTKTKNLPTIDPTQLPAWKKLQQHFSSMKSSSMRELFVADPKRAEQFSLSAANLFLDYSKNRVTQETMDLLFDLANACELKTNINALFQGEKINCTEERAALHTALRETRSAQLMLNGKNIIPDIHAELDKMRDFITKTHAGNWRGYRGDPITDVVNIGIGGSNLGPAMATAALAPYAHPVLRCHFISNVDGAEIHTLLPTLNPATTLFIISSKSFTTLETLMNARAAIAWLKHAAGEKTDLSQHLVAVTANPEKAIAFGVSPQHIFTLWDWVGGRYSLWSAIGLPIALSIGMDHFDAMLAGAKAMDEHFHSAPFEKNMPVILALLGIWYINFFGAQSHAIVPYDHYLSKLPTYLQQVDMESNGKRVRRDGAPVNYATGPIIWGAVGCNSQHAFHQLLHQGTGITPIDFIIASHSHHDLPNHHALLFANCLSQSQAFMRGKTEEEVIAELIADGYSQEAAKKIAPHKVIPGNRPSNTIVLPQLTPTTLGALLALYEHKVFTQGVIWQINSFDQWGIELGKQLATTILPYLEQLDDVDSLDASTRRLIAYYHSARKI